MNEKHPIAIHILVIQFEKEIRAPPIQMQHHLDNVSVSNTHVPEMTVIRKFPRSRWLALE